MSGDAPAARAIAALDALIAAAPPCDLDGARQAFEALVTLRDGLAARHRAGEAVAAPLARVNAALALTWSGALPVAGFRAGRLERAKALLEGWEA